MHHLLEHINQDIKRRSSKDKDSAVTLSLINEHETSNLIYEHVIL